MPYPAAAAAAVASQQLVLSALHFVTYKLYVAYRRASCHVAAQPESRHEEEEEGLHGVHRQLCRNEHPKTKEGCKKFSGKQARHVVAASR
jgi:hypothetical protein